LRATWIEHPRSYLAAAPKALPALFRYGITRFERHTLLATSR
jgi:hypothetical protein